MISVDHIQSFGWEPALRGMRNPLDSWDRADSEFDVWRDEEVDAETGLRESWREPVHIGPNDESLMRRLIGQGSADHCKFRRMIAIYCDVTAPLYWWKEYSTYRVGTVMNSCSTMHTLMDHEFTPDMFSFENTYAPARTSIVENLNKARSDYLEWKDAGDEDVARNIWRSIIQLLPESWNQKRTVMLNYEVMANIYRARKNHKLKEWRDFIDAMVTELPYPWIFTGEGC